MKIKALTIVTTLIVLPFVITGCSSIKDDGLVQVMKIAPGNTVMIGYFNIRTMLKDPDLKHLYSDIVNELEYQIEGIEVSDISVYAAIENYKGYLTVLIGDFNLGDIRDILEDKDYTEGEFRGVEIWSDDFDNTIAFVDRMIILGDKDAVRECIRIHNNEEPSLYDNRDMRSVVDRLPNGIAYMVFSQDYKYGTEILAGGASYGNLNSGDEALDFTGIFKFKSKTDAEEALGEVEDYTEMQLGYSVSDSKIRDQYIEITGEMDLEDFD